MSRAHALLVLILVTVLGGGTSYAQDRPLRVITATTAPFVIPQTDPPTGFSIDLWREIARRMGVQYSWQLATSLPELLTAVEKGDADVAISAIAMTEERERRVDLSHSYFDSGLQIAVRVRNDPPMLSALLSFPWWETLRLVGIAILIIFIMANVMWLIERRRNVDFQKSYVRSVGEGLWSSMLVISTGEYGERSEPGVIKRVTVGLMWVFGVVLIAQFTATVTSTQTLNRLQSDIKGPEDLPGKRIATAPGSTAAEYLTRRGLSFVPLTSVDEALSLLTRGDVQAIVFEAPTLHFWAARRGQGVLKVVGPLFQKERYSIAVALGSHLRKQIDEALLGMYEDGTYEDLHAKWFLRGND